MAFWNRFFRKDNVSKDIQNIQTIESRPVKKKKKKKVVEPENIYDNVISRDTIDVHDPGQRDRYVKTCLEQMATASRELETLTNEYNLVTSYLTDMELIESLEPDAREQVANLGKKIIELNDNHEKRKNRKPVIKEDDYRHMERIEEYMPAGLTKLKEAEDYQILIKKDLNRLDGERHAYDYRKYDILRTQKNMKIIVAVCLAFMALLVIVLSILSVVLKIDVQIGYLAAVLITAVALTILYVKHNGSAKELVRIEKTINKLVLLQNTVKIRYVNNTNLLEYLYVKYGVDNWHKLNKMWKAYEEEKKLRQEEDQLAQDMDYSNAALVRVLRKLKLEDPNIWTHQAVALFDKREMANIRHELILRRQQLRKQMEYNSEIAQNAQNEISGLVESHPEYAKPILDIVSEYEKALA